MSRRYLGDFVNSRIEQDIEVVVDRLMAEYELANKKSICLPRLSKDEQYKVMKHYNIDFVPTYKSTFMEDSGLDLKEYLLEYVDNQAILKPTRGALAQGVYLIKYKDLISYIEDGKTPRSFHEIAGRLGFIKKEKDLDYSFTNILQYGVWSRYKKFNKEYRVYLFLESRYIVMQDRSYDIETGDFDELLQYLRTFSELDLELYEYLTSVLDKFITPNRIPFLAIDIVEDENKNYSMIEFSGEIALQENVQLETFRFIRSQTTESIKHLTE